MDPTFAKWLESAMEGITWLDLTMGLITVVGLWFTFWQALKATKAATAARDAIATTRASLMRLDLAHDFRQIHGLIKDATRAIEDDDAAVTKHVLVQLSELMHRAVALAENESTPPIEAHVLEDLKAAAIDSTSVKVAIAKSKVPKTRTLAKDLTPIFDRLGASLIKYEAIEKFATSEEP
jgi:hypothetical protein